MIEFNGIYFDGKTSKAHPVTMRFSGSAFAVHGEGLETMTFSLAQCEIPPALGRTTRSILLPGGARCETDEVASVTALERHGRINQGMRLVNFLESRWRLVAVCFAGLILGTWLFITQGIPLIAGVAAAAVPPKVMEKISLHSLRILDERFFSPTSLPEQRIRELEDAFAGLVAGREKEFDFRLEFRSGRGVIGANAFALPSGLILMTDELVSLAEHDPELLGILYHEVAHVENRHGLRTVLQNAGVFLLVSALVGDIASITSAASTLPMMLVQQGYSRDFEREADHAAGLYLIEQGWGPKSLQDILQRLSENQPDIPGISLFSTHPATEERVANLELLINR